MTPRIENLRQIILNAEDDVCLDRARIITESYKANSADSPVIKRAKGIRDVLCRMKQYILPGELIVGNLTSKPGAWVVFPEFGFEENRIVHNEHPELVGFFSSRIPDDLREFWSDKNLAAHYRAYMRSVLGSEAGTGGGWSVSSGLGHITIDYGRALRDGFDETANRIRKRRDEIQRDDPEGAEYLTAMLLCIEGAICYAERYADLVQAEAKDCPDHQRKKELLEIARICRHVAHNPATNFREACQLFWFVHQIMHIEGNGYSMSPGRFDQYMYPYFKADRERGRITDEEAIELLENLWLKFVANTVWGTKHNETQSLVLSGSDASGRDLTNELSYLCLKATADVRTYEPLVWVRWHKGIPQDFFDECLRMLADGLGFPIFLSDEVVPEMMMNLGVSREDAYEYVPIGCNELGITGKLWFRGTCGLGYLRALQLAMNGGRDWNTGKLCGAKTPPPSELRTFDDLLRALADQLRLQADNNFRNSQALLLMHQRYGQLPFTSAFMSGCIERARDLTIRSDYNVQCSGGNAFANLVDCVVALKTVVYEQRTASLEEVIEACKANFKGYEGLRKKLLAAPKFGNGDERADTIANMLSRLRNEVISHIRDSRDGTPLAANHVVRSSSVPAGRQTPATPDGRLAGTPLANSIAAAQGTDRNGPTGLLNSVIALDAPRNWRGGYNVNLRLDPELLRHEESRRKVAAMLSSYFERGGQQLQINAISSDVLRDAQKHPERYSNLIVRVAGYSDYFVNLRRDVQEEIIARTEHRL